MAIQLLEKNIINKIAAGEVVERPFSVVKELIENSIDAESSAITVEIKKGGKKYIRITDNGVGISNQDVKIAFKRHATSKIKDENDLYKINSLGFRGEALASISAVSMVEMITKTREELTGTRIEINGGDIKSFSEVGAPEGTTLIIKNLFYNTPARLEFLKSSRSEVGAISDIINKLALAHPEISFKFISDNKTKLHTSGSNNLKITILDVYDKEIAKNLVKVDCESEKINLRGFIGKSNISRASRKYENTFINGRYIKSNIISKAVEDALKNFIMINKFPFFVLRIDINPMMVDVNVHPTKMEVRFTNEEEIYDFIFNEIKSVISNEILIPKATFDNKKYKEKRRVSENLTNKYKTEAFEVKNNIINNKEEKIDLGEENQSIKKSEVRYFEKPKIQHKEVVQEVIKDMNDEKKRKVIDYKIIGQVFNTYFIVEQDSKMYIIDQHAAHERILYETFLEEYKNEKITSQMLVSPIVINLDINDLNILEDNIQLFKDFGFEIEDFGSGSYLIRSVPIMFGKPTDDKFFLDIIDGLSEGKINKLYSTKEDAIINMSCKAAVKGKDKLSYREAEKLIKRLFELENPYSCPHGRPTIISMSEYELEKKFKRIQ